MKFLKILNKKEVKDFEKDSENKINISGTIKDFVDTKRITKDTILKNIGFIFMIFFLAIIYIGNRFNAERLVRDAVNLKKERSELRSEHIATASELMFLSKQSEIMELVDSFKLGLIESTEPPIKIKVEENN